MSDALMAHGPEGAGPPVELVQVPFFPQTEHQCGPAALATVLTASGVEVTPAGLTDQVFLPARRGSLRTEMVAAARRHQRIPYPLEPSLPALLGEVRAGHPVLVFQNLGLDWYPRWHFAVVVGFDPEVGELILRSGTVKRHRTGLRLFERTWKRGDHWALVVLTPGELPATARPETYFRAVADFERLGDKADALEAYAAGHRRWPAHPLLAMGYAGAHHSTGNRDQAIRVLSRLVREHPDYAPAHNNLASLLLAAGRPALAEEHARRAVALGGPHAATYRRTLREILAYRRD